MTLSALTKNREWNTRIISTQQGEYAQHVLEEYRELWNSRYTVSYEQFRESYRLEYEKNRIQREVIRKQKEIARKKEIPSIVQYRLHPNKMQVEFIRNLKELREYGAERALLISATGTGKTYASAFAMRELGFRRVLFLVHRGQLARQTKKAYEMVFDSTVSMGLVGGGYHEYEKDYIFATVQTLNRDEHLLRYCPDEFDCIILDEAHHSSADTYQRVMHYFRPKLWLGMTATPDKRDDNIEGRNIYEIFDHQIAYEIRLQQAMEENMLCPFHYFGISDLSMVDDRDRKSKKMTEKDFQYLTGTERVKHIIEQANYYGYSGERVKGLIFCSRIDESIALSEKFNEAGFRTIALNGSASEEERAEAFERLAMDEQDATEARQPLDYIFSVEILNEGVDIVEVNQVIMLRPTESPIVFIQQLGRGLRKSEGKEYVVVLDFIGNYKNNFMIPIALSGDRSYNKDNIRRYLLEGGRVIPGESTIHFDEVSRKQIFASVDNANFSDIKLIRENYTNLKNKLGKIPGLLDFDQYGEMDVLRIFDNHSLGSYYKFLVKYEKEYQVRLTKDEENIIEFVSKKLANGKRIHELAMLNRILLYAHGFKKMHVFSELKKTLSEEYGRTMDEKQKENLVSMMTNEFPAGTGKKTYEKCVFIEPDQDGEYQIAPSFLAMLEDNVFYQMLRELVAFGISRYQRDYSNTYKDTNFVLYQKYTYEDVCRLLNWEKNEVPLNIGGYKFDKKTGTFPVFINYDKAENISDTTKYEDHFISSSSLVAISKSGRSLESEDVQNFLNAKERGIQVELFVRKNKDDKISKEFYYLGHMNASGKAREFTMPNTTKTAVEIEWILEEPVREDLYQYIVNE
jgi:superfamily II DNA or RNA helicase